MKKICWCAVTTELAELSALPHCLRLAARGYISCHNQSKSLTELLAAELHCG